jgi:hypothetical protein
MKVIEMNREKLESLSKINGGKDRKHHQKPRDRSTPSISVEVNDFWLKDKAIEMSQDNFEILKNKFCPQR